ncbi:NUDIX domain-containing protein [uncultured Bifidobacterium sp.]|uniref:NUDIX hydrolase n=1 Tax=uncultured Bifidobacterium sp. TaxID=165187 RepID=UPI00260D45D2|nr:NUDIX domain-containing protein [uncultured Bifidobacterium sp.]
MTTPTFITELRAYIGHRPLWLSGVTAYVEDETGHVLLGRRSDTAEWALVSGIVEPGENPADTVIREVAEETGVDVVVDALASVSSSSTPVVYPNGDITRYLDLTFQCHAAPGGRHDARVGDDESLDVGWFDRNELPQPLSRSTTTRMEDIRRFIRNQQDGDARALFTVDTTANQE